MREIFYPGSVAVIGVSNSPDNMGQSIVRNLIEFGFQGFSMRWVSKGGLCRPPDLSILLDIPDRSTWP